MKSLVLFLSCVFTFTFFIGNSQGLFVNDIDGNRYPVVKIGDLYWMASNLKTTRLNDGTPIQQVKITTTEFTTLEFNYYSTLNTGLSMTHEQWSEFNKPSFLYYNNSETNALTYGLLYSYNAASSSKICPAGWRLISKDDWEELIKIYPFDLDKTQPNIADLNAKKGWRIITYNTYNPNDGMDVPLNLSLNGTNTTSFTALPGGGYLGEYFNFNDKGNNAFFWTKNKATNQLEQIAYTGRWAISGGEMEHIIDALDTDKESAYSIRCVCETMPQKDETLFKESKKDQIVALQEALEKENTKAWFDEIKELEDRAHLNILNYNLLNFVDDSLSNTIYNLDEIQTKVSDLEKGKHQLNQINQNISFELESIKNQNLKLTLELEALKTKNQSFVNQTNSEQLNNSTNIIEFKEENCESARKKYLEQNQDVKKANLDPWNHYLGYGKKEGRKWPSCEENSSTTNNPTSNSTANSSTSSNVVVQSGSYKSVKIGTQTWMTENLNVATFRNGDPIPEAKSNEEWEKAGKEGKPAWCFYENDPKNGAKYGKLYNWYAVSDPRGLAPNGWHVPTDAEWKVLENYLGEDAGKKMKSTSGWDSYGCQRCDGGSDEFKRLCSACKGKQVNSTDPFNGNGTNSSGFSGIPGGGQSVYGSSGHGTDSNWWSSSEIDIDEAYFSGLENDYDHLHIGLRLDKNIGNSIRCIKD